jgi:hypothetical protein
MKFTWVRGKEGILWATVFQCTMQLVLHVNAMGSMLELISFLLRDAPNDCTEKSCKN